MSLNGYKSLNYQKALMAQAQAQQQLEEWRRMQQAKTWAINDYSNDYYTWTSTAATDNSIIVTNDFKPPATPSKPKPETALAWLDRRVNEMRVAL